MRDMLALWGLRDAHGATRCGTTVFFTAQQRTAHLERASPLQTKMRSPRRFERAAKKQLGEAQSLRNAVALAIH